ncbi:hypothetical protein ABFP37_18775 [Burkholderia sp. RS01]|uniref:hypothetical protein n=1 Tax=unclassified Burkholderia TaxID=2613784 RepID=UPI003218BF1A
MAEMDAFVRGVRALSEKDRLVLGFIVDELDNAYLPEAHSSAGNSRPNRHKESAFGTLFVSVHCTFTTTSKLIFEPSSTSVGQKRTTAGASRRRSSSMFLGCLRARG